MALLVLSHAETSITSHSCSCTGFLLLFPLAMRSAKVDSVLGRHAAVLLASDGARHLLHPLTQDRPELLFP